MFSSKVMKAIACEVEDDKMEMIERLKIFLKEKIDGDYEEIDEWIDEFAKGEFDGSRKKSSKKSSSPKKKRKQSHYSLNQTISLSKNNGRMSVMLSWG